MPIWLFRVDRLNVNRIEDITMVRVIIPAIIIWFPLLAAAVDCTKEYQQHLKTDLDLSYIEFDQTMSSGMRILSSAGCHKETADLIEAYILKNEATENSLRWHVAQQRAMADEYSLAIHSAKKALVETEDFSKQPLRWNDYVLATIAFMEGDKDTLIFHRNNVAKSKGDYFGNELNLKLLDGLIKHFGKSYGYATSNL